MSVDMKHVNNHRDDIENKYLGLKDSQASVVVNFQLKIGNMAVGQKEMY